MPDVTGGYQPDTKSESARRADFDQLRLVKATQQEVDSVGEIVAGINEVTIGDTEPTDDSELWISLDGVIHAKIDGTWTVVGKYVVPAGSTYVITPAEAGARADQPSQARFGNINEASKRVGFIAPATGGNLVINPYNEGFALYDRTSDGTSYRNSGELRLDDAATIYPWRLSSSPHGGSCLVPAGVSGTTDYTLLTLGW